MSQDIIAEYESLLDEYSKIKERAAQIRDRIAELQQQIKEEIKFFPPIHTERVCIYCGSTKYYAKGYCRNCYNRAKNNGTPEPLNARKIKLPKPKTKKQIWLETDWKDRLYKAVFLEDRPDDAEVPPDYEDGIYHALSTLTPREEQLIFSRYMDGMSLKKCGDKLGGLSTERARQIEVKALRKLRQTKQDRYIMYGLSKAKHMEQEEEREVQEALKKEHEEKERLIREKEKMFAERISKLKRDSEIYNLPIEEFDLSVRAFNSLYRAGFRDRKSIIEYIYENGGDAAECLMKIRKCGRKTVEEIIEKLYIPYIQPNI